jgi:hypothetical protein
MMLGLGDAGTSTSAATYYQPGSWFCDLSDIFMTSAQAMVCAGMSAPAVPNVPTQAQLDAVSTSSDPSAAASALVQSLTNDATTETQQQIQAGVNAVPDSPYSVPVSVTPFCGSGSTQWISGIDNCVLLAGGAIGVLGLMALIESSGAKFARG